MMKLRKLRKLGSFLLMCALLTGVAMAQGEGGLQTFFISDWPDHPRDDVEFEAVFTVQPDRGSVRLVLSGSGGNRTVPPHDVDFEHGLWEYEFDDIYLSPGTWTPTLHWSVNGKPYTSAQESFTIR